MIQRLTAFEAEAEICGRLRRVRFDADTNAVSIEVAGIEEASAILDVLGTTAATDARYESVNVAAGIPAAERAVLADVPIEGSSKAEPVQEAPKAAKKTRRGRKSSAKKVVSEADPDEPKGSPSPSQVEAAHEELDEGNVTDDVGTLQEGDEGYDYVSEGREALEEKAAAEKSKKAVQAAKGGAVPEELKNAKKLRNVVGYLHDEMGITHPDAILAKCEELQSHVPALKRLKSSLKERVARTIEVLKIGS